MEMIGESTIEEFCKERDRYLVEKFGSYGEQLQNVKAYLKESNDFRYLEGAKAHYAPCFSTVAILEWVFDSIPDNQKYDAFIDVYIMAKDCSRWAWRFIPSIRECKPAAVKTYIRELADSEGNIIVYRGGLERRDPARFTSWTISLEVAEFFAKCTKGKETVVYKGVITADDVAAYTDERQEQEIIQFRRVKHIEKIRHYGKGSKTKR
ncbi:MAG: hypothetical protein LBC46_00735 [Treponema sp.]|nr:hypothetical protein [Treponema sp.]